MIRELSRKAPKMRKGVGWNDIFWLVDLSGEHNLAIRKFWITEGESVIRMITDVNIENEEWSSRSHEEKNHLLYLR